MRRILLLSCLFSLTFMSLFADSSILRARYSGITRQDSARVMNIPEQARNYFMSIKEDSPYYKDAQEMLYYINDCTPLRISDEELLRYTRVQSWQATTYGLFKYKFFPCSIRLEGNTLFFQKLKGSQRKAGLIYRWMDKVMLFTGAWGIEDEPILPYGSDRSEVAVIFHPTDDVILFLFPQTDDSFEIYKLIP